MKNIKGNKFGSGAERKGNLSRKIQNGVATKDVGNEEFKADVLERKRPELKNSRNRESDFRDLHVRKFAFMNT